MSRDTHRQAWYVINGITFYRIIAAPLLLVLLYTGHYDLFKWLLGVSFFTDLIDGWLARKFKVTSVLGARLDSIGDDLTILVGIIALFVIMPDFIWQQRIFLIILAVLFLIQTSFALIRYGRITSFHTWLAKTAALLQGLFLLVTFFWGKPQMILFYSAMIITALELIEEILLVGSLKNWETNVKSIFVVLKRRKHRKTEHGQPAS